MFATFERIVARLENALLAVSVACLLTIAAIIMLVLLERSGLGPRIPDNVILMQQLMVVAVGCSLAYVTRVRDHISIDLLYAHLGRSLRRAADFAAIIVGLVASLPVSVWAFVNFRKSFRSGAYYFGEMNLPEWPAKLLFFLAFATISLRLLIQLVQLAKGDLGEVEAGPEHLEAV